jgi:hypothetical protein
MREKSMQLGRRAFFRLLSLLTGAGALSRTSAAHSRESSEPRQLRRSHFGGYQETEHIRKYYDKARL